MNKRTAIIVVVLITVFLKLNSMYVHGSHSMKNKRWFPVKVDKLEFLTLHYNTWNGKTYALYKDNGNKRYEVYLYRGNNNNEKNKKKYSTKQVYIVYGKTKDDIIGVFILN